MKKILILIFTGIIIASMVFVGISCKVGGATAEEGAPAEEAAEEAIAEGGSLTAFWFEWDPANYLRQVSQEFTAETGIDFVLETTTPPNWVAKINTEMIAGGDAWDLIVTDSQDVAVNAVNEHFVNMTDWIIENEVDKNFTEASMTYYSEYPKGSGEYWGVPCEGDSLGFAYRKDLFEDPDNMAAFEAEYGYPLDVPQSYDMILDIAKFFHDPDNGFYGIAVYGDNGYDSSAMFAEGLIWAYGGDLGDYETYEVDGILNSEGSIKGLEVYRELYKLTPPGFGNAFFIESNDAFVGGLVPMAINFYAFFPALANPETNPYADDTGYFTCPEQEGVDGVTRQISPLGGMCISINSYSSKQDLAWKWMEWWIRPETQQKWAAAGGFTTHIETLNSQAFLDATPFNPSFKKSMETLKDFWSEPDYSALLRTFSENIGPYITAGEGTAKEALDASVADWEEIFGEAGYYD